MLKHKNFWLILLLSGLLGLAAFYFWPPQTLKANQSLWKAESVKPFKQWYQINWQQQAVGWASVELLRKENVISIIEEDLIEGRVQGERLRFQFKRQLNFSNKKPYKLISGRIHSIEPNLEVEKTFLIDKQFLVTSKRNAKVTTEEKPLIEYHLQDYLALRAFIEKAPAINQIKIVKELNSDDFGLHYSRYQVMQIPAGDLVYYQLKHQLQNSEKLNDPYQSQASFHSITPEGVTFKKKLASGMTFVASDNKVSLNPEMQRDLYLGAGISVNQPLGQPTSISYLSLALAKGSLEWFRGHPALIIRNNQLILRSGYQYQTAKPVAIAANHPKVNELAQLHTSGLRTANEQVKELVKFVHEYLTYKTLPASFNLDDILTNKIGDCTEHALLLSKMLNSIGLPARQVSGLIYLGDEQQRFGGHVWVEVYYDGFWHAVDPTWNLTRVTATHIPLMIGAEKSPAILAKAQQTALKVGKISYFKR